MPKLLFSNSTDIWANCGAKPWKNVASDQSEPHVHLAATNQSINKSLFRAPLGIMHVRTKFISTTSVFRDGRMGNARLLEYYQYVMQPMSIFLLLPHTQMTALDDYTLRRLKHKFSAAVEQMREKKTKVVLPYHIFKQLEKAKLNDSYTSKLSDQETPAESVPEERDFNADGPFVIVMYDNEKKLISCVTRVFRVDENLGIMGTMIEKLQRRDGKLLKKLWKDTENTKTSTSAKNELADSPRSDESSMPVQNTTVSDPAENDTVVEGTKECNEPCASADSKTLEESTDSTPKASASTLPDED